MPKYLVCFLDIKAKETEDSSDIQLCTYSLQVTKNCCWRSRRRMKLCVVITNLFNTLNIVPEQHQVDIFKKYLCGSYFMKKSYKYIMEIEITRVHCCFDNDTKFKILH